LVRPFHFAIGGTTLEEQGIGSGQGTHSRVPLVFETFLEAGDPGSDQTPDVVGSLTSRRLSA
jgi:hypothetical protein